MAASDEIVWQVINQQFCSFKLKLNNKTQTFCRNEHNLTGFCNRQSCPLANSRYATVRPDPATNGLYLYIKTPERAHLPSQWWEKIRLPNNYEKALAMIDDKLQYWNKFTIHKCKQRLTRLTQVAIRARRIAKEEERLGEKLVPKLASKVQRRESTRERKAEAAAKVEKAIEKELLERLRSGAYGEKQPINVEESIWRKVLRGLEREEKGEDLDVEEEEEEEAEAEVEYVSDIGDSDAEDLEDFDDWLGDESGDDETEDSEESDGSEESDEEEGSEQDNKTLPGTKRKRAAPPPKARKRQAGKPEIEIEIEDGPRETIFA